MKKLINNNIMNMSSGVVPPRYGELVPLICLKCHNHFIGPNPSGPSIPDDILKKIKRAKCPKCGSRRVVRNPWVCY